MDITECELMMPVYVCDTQRTEDMTERLLGHMFIHRQLVVCTGGFARVHIHGGTERDFRKGMVMFIEKGARFLMRPGKDGVSFVKIAFDGRFAPQYLGYYGFHLVTIVQGSESCVRKANRVVDLFEAENYTEASIEIYEFIGEIGDKLISMRERVRTVDEMIIRSYRDFVKNNIHNPELRADGYLRRTNLTAEKLDALSREYYNSDADEMIHGYRIEYVKYAIFLIISPDPRSYYRRCGYRSPEELEQDFLSRTGRTVREYYDELFG